MLRRFSFPALIAALILSFGCTGKKETDSKDKVTVREVPQELIAVIDLNVVAQEIGAMTKINQSIKERESELVDKLAGLKVELGRQYDEEKSKLGSDLNQQQRGELDRMLVDHRETISLQAQAAQAQLASHHANLKVKLLNQVRPVAYEVARDNGMNLVLTTSQVYAAGPNVDITQQVIKRIKALNKQDQPANAQSEPEGVRVAEMPGGGDFMPQ